MRKGLRGQALRDAVNADERHRKLVAQRKQRLMDDRLIASVDEERRYVLSTDQDYEILNKIHQLEQRELSEADRTLVTLIRTQLEADWRTPLIRKLDELLEQR